MALYPPATKKLIPPGSSDPRIKARIAILHVAASLATSLFTWFRKSGGIESHFFVTLTGKVEQYRDTDWQADANLDANDFAISIETAGLGSGSWNKRQLAAIKKLLLWLHETHDIPLVQVPAWNGAGVGYHVQFGAPGPWTPVAKTCPGPKRIEQFKRVLVPWMAKQRMPKLPPFPNVKSANLGDGSPGKVEADLHALVFGAGIVATQEAGDRKTELAEVVDTHPGIAVWKGLVPGAASVAMLYRKHLRPRRISRLAIKAMVVGRGAGPDTAKPKAINGLRVKKLVVLNTHMVASAWQDNADPRRKAHYRAHIAVVARMARRRLKRGLDVLIVGDFNAPPDHPLLKPLRDAGLRQLVDVPTHGKQTFDQAWSNRPGTVTTRATSSDHKAISVNLKEKR